MGAALKLADLRMTLDEFLAWDAPGETYWELVDGKPIAMAPNSDAHGTITSSIIAEIETHLRAWHPTYYTMTASGIIPKTLRCSNYRIPDVSVVCRDADGTPRSKVLIEVLSPSNHTHTWSNVWLYTSIATVAEILVVSSNRLHAQVLRRLPDGSWPEETIVAEAGDVTLASIDFAVPVASFYRNTSLG